MAARLLRLPPAELAHQLVLECPGIDEQIHDHAQRLESQCRRGELWAVCLHADEYPDRLRAFCDAPHVLYGAGRLERFRELSGIDSVAIVGARRASSYGRDVAYRLGDELATTGVTVVSGMALGVDGAAHRGALRARARTIAVLAGGPDSPYPPSHRRLHEQIVAGGSVVSESPPGVRARRWAFPARNRIIAALSAITILVEATESSGARHTVEFAFQAGRSVGAVPGPVTSPLSALPNALLADGAQLIRGADDVLEVLGLAPRQASLQVDVTDGLAGSQLQIFECIASGDNTPAAIQRRIGNLTPRDVNRELGSLELAGVIRRNSDGSYAPATNN